MHGLKDQLMSPLWQQFRRWKSLTRHWLRVRDIYWAKKLADYRINALGLSVNDGNLIFPDLGLVLRREVDEPLLRGIPDILRLVKEAGARFETHEDGCLVVN